MNKSHDPFYNPLNVDYDEMPKRISYIIQNNWVSHMDGKIRKLNPY